MAKFNKKQTTSEVANLAGGQAYSLDARTELVTMLLSSFMTVQHYRSAEDALKRLRELVARVDAEFAMKAAIYARDKFHLRSVTHAVAAELAATAKGAPGLRRFLQNVVQRPDDIAEIISAYLSAHGERRANGKAKLPSGLKKGLRQAFDHFDDYQIAKYKMETREWAMVDLVNMLRPVPTERNAKALRELVEDKLAAADTWEANLSKAGGDQAAKEETWSRLLREKKLGYMALLRNLRNIEQQAPGLIDLACEQLTDAEKIRGSKVLPFRYYTAFKHTEDARLRAAISDACDTALANVPELKDTCVFVDVSGSMETPAGGGQTTCMEAAALFAAVCAKASMSDIVQFSTGAAYFKYNPRDSVLGIARQIIDSAEIGGTSFMAAIGALTKPYERLMFFSDMQGWLDPDFSVSYLPRYRDYAHAALQQYKKEYRVDPWVYCIDLCGYGTSKFPLGDSKVIELAGFSERLFQLLRFAEEDRHVLMREIEAVAI